VIGPRFGHGGLNHDRADGGRCETGHGSAAPHGPDPAGVGGAENNQPSGGSGRDQGPGGSLRAGASRSPRCDTTASR
jgi:hypothetical protein